MAIDVRPHQKFSGVFWTRLEDGSRRLATKNLVPGRKVYGERLVPFNGDEFRLWNAYRSKLAAAMLKGLNTFPIGPSQTVLYLGSASGTTASHISDIVEEKGHVYCIELAPRTMRELVDNVCTHRHNMTPILEDARKPEKYSLFVSKVDHIYCDVAQPEQAKIVVDNAQLYLKKKGYAILAIKSRSVDVTKKPDTVYKQEIGVLKRSGFLVMDVVKLEPYDKAHAMIVSKI